MRKLKVGITADLKTSLFSNGINQNALYLAMVYNDMGHDAHIIATGEDFKAQRELISIGVDNLPIKKLSDVLGNKEHYDIIIILGLRLEVSHVNALKHVNPNLKTVSYRCGNELFTDTEIILFDAHGGRSDSFQDLSLPPKPDQIWSIPQMEVTNLDYYTYMNGGQRDATVVPFIWDPIVTESLQKTEKIPNWGPRDTRRVSIMEPNLSLMKNAILPITFCDWFMRDGERLDSVYSWSTQKLSTNKRLIKVIQQGNPNLIKILSAEDRRPTLRVLNQYTDLVLSWQIENNLNYLYFDVMWAGWPLVHNAQFCQDIGYYYHMNQAGQAAAGMKDAFENHNIERGNEMKEKIKRFTRFNPALIEQYRMLTENLINGVFVKQKYHWETNTVSPL